MRRPFKKRRSSADLAAVVEALPRPTRVAMLKGLARETIIAGAYTDSRGGVCPMLAAHRAGARTSGTDFARTWDRFTGAARPVRARRADIAALRGLLEASLAPQAPGAAWLRPVRRYDDLCTALEDLGMDEGLTLDVIGGRRDGRAAAITQGELP